MILKLVAQSGQSGKTVETHTNIICFSFTAMKIVNNRNHKNKSTARYLILNNIAKSSQELGTPGSLVTI